jgi:hypothetical protein
MLVPACRHSRRRCPPFSRSHLISLISTDTVETVTLHRNYWGPCCGSSLRQLLSTPLQVRLSLCKAWVECQNFGPITGLRHRLHRVFVQSGQPTRSSTTFVLPETPTTSPWSRAARLLGSTLYHAHSTEPFNLADNPADPFQGASNSLYSRLIIPTYRNRTSASSETLESPPPDKDQRRQHRSQRHWDGNDLNTCIVDDRRANHHGRSEESTPGRSNGLPRAQGPR